MVVLEEKSNDDLARQYYIQEINGGGGGGIPEAPIDGNTYGRLNATWAIAGGGGIWSRSGTNTYLTNIDDFVGIGTNTPFSSNSKLDIIGPNLSSSDPTFYVENKSQYAAYPLKFVASQMAVGGPIDFSFYMASNRGMYIGTVTDHALSFFCNDGWEILKLVSEGGYSSNGMAIFGSGNYHYNPSRRVEIFDYSDPQLRLTENYGVTYADFQVDNYGYLNLDITNGYLMITPQNVGTQAGLSLISYGGTEVDIYQNAGEGSVRFYMGTGGGAGDKFVIDGSTFEGIFSNDVSCKYVSTDNNEYLATDVIRHTITATDVANHYVEETWSKTTIDKIVTMNTSTRQVVVPATPVSPLQFATQSNGDGDYYDGTKFHYTIDTAKVGDGDESILWVVYEK
jgi:hypothetical protein